MNRSKQRKLRTRKMQLSRRGFLRGLGGVTLALPWLEKLAPKANAAAPTAEGPRRVIVMAYEMGVPLGEWRPSAATNFNLPYVTAPLDPFKDRCLFVSSIDNRVLDAGRDAFVWGHPAKKEAALTGTLTTGAFPSTNNNHIDEVRTDAETTGGANGPSVEHLIGEALRQGHPRASVDLCVDGYAAAATWGPPDPTHTSNFFFESRANPITLMGQPSAAFDDLFAALQSDPNAQPDPAIERLRARNQSVLDAVRDSFKDLESGLGHDDRMRLQEHAARIRQLEIDVQLSATCSAPTGIDAIADYSGWRMDQLAPLQSRILAHAMACGMAPVGRLEFLQQQNPRFGIPDLDNSLDAAEDFDWHGMVHGDPLPGTTAFLRPGRDESVTTYDQRLLDGYRFFVEQFAGLLAALDAIPEGQDQTALDHSLVILASDLGEGLGHGHMKMGYIAAGNLGGARTGLHYDAGPAMPFEVGGGYYYSDSRNNVSQLLHSFLDMAGVVDAQGNPVWMGLDGYLQREGMARRIDALFG